jgi:hypothetical protein
MLVKTSESEEKWCPTPIYNLESLLQKQIKQGSRFVHVRALRKNIAYNLQYLEFIHRCLEDLKLTSVIITQNIKIFIIVGCGIIESLLTFLLIKRGEYSQTEWELDSIMPGQEKEWEQRKIRIDSHIYKKLDKLERKEMSFNSMLEKAESKKILGSDHNVYAKLKYLRKLRNKVHLQIIDEPSDTDWNAFQYRHICAMAQIIYSVFTSNIFRPSAYEKKYFKYLEKYLEEEIEVDGDL